jgi:hypothetical protein
MSWNEASTPQNNGAAWPPRYDTVAIIYHGAAVLRATTLWLKQFGASACSSLRPHIGARTHLGLP